jgi:serine/threonine protein kinase
MYPLYLYAYAAPPQEQCQLTDQLLEQYSDDIKMMNNRGRPIIVDHPPPPSMVESHALAHVDQDWRESYAAPSQRRGLNPSPPLTTSFADDSETIEEILDHRASVREYLQGQFYLQQTYSEHLHWTRVRQIGHGGQARCYCIEDNVNKYPLCLKEETESKKALDEAFICLKLARLVNDAPPNIVEFFGASILPHFSGKHSLQLFLELMPGCLQGHVFENGPLSSEAVLNYSYQLFEALDYLHQTLKVIHCDIKPANLLIDYNCQRLKVADFGCAELLEECCHGKGCTGNKDAGTLWYNPPQYYCTGNCSFGMDIWQAGCSVLFMVTGRRPWRHLCMDVDKSSPLVTTTTAALRKKRYCKLIGDQRGVYPLPGFLTSGVQQLLTGCLQFPPRLSAKDCVYLSVVSEATSPQQESRIVKELGYSPAHDVLDRLHSSACTPPVVDVYLGKDRFNTDVEGVPHVILSGWLGSVPYQNGMTYGDLLHSTRQHLPVTQYFEDCCLATSDNDPQTIWKTVTIGNARPYRVRNDQLVDPARAFILYPIERTCV